MPNCNSMRIINHELYFGLHNNAWDMEAYMHNRTLLWGVINHPCSSVNAMDVIIIPPASTKLKEGLYIGFTSSIHLSVGTFVRLSVRPSVDKIVSALHLPQYIPIFAHLIKQLHWRCVACKGYYKIPKFEFLANFWKFVTSILSFYDMGSISYLHILSNNFTEGVSRVRVITKFQNLNFWRIFENL